MPNACIDLGEYEALVASLVKQREEFRTWRDDALDFLEDWLRAPFFETGEAWSNWVNPARLRVMDLIERARST